MLKNAFFRLDLGQISFNLVEDASATRQLAFLATSFAFYDILTWACAEIKIFLLSFSFLFAAVICNQKTSKKTSRRAIFTSEQPGVVAGNFAEFFIQFFLAFLCISQAPFGQSL